MDPLDDVLALLKANAHVSSALWAGGRWALRFDPPSGVKFNAVRRGNCLLWLDGEAEPVVLAEGDCFLLTKPLGFTLASDRQTPPQPAGPLFASAVDGVARVGADEQVNLIGGAFAFTARAGSLLLDSLPPLIHVRATDAEATTAHWAIDQIDAELRTAQLGGTLVAEHLAMVLLIRILRLHLSHNGGTGWLAGLADPVLVHALRAIHARPAHPWTVAALARTVAVSRSTLAARFKKVIGQGPLEYLTGWRIELAADRIRRGDETLASIARTVGYSSESALSVAFKRVTGMTPRTYRRQAGIT
ncbi:AraC family transcriptional regulator [Catellatospora aurea]|uniref:AraC family transcriptional regulator n=1 Tax=Catellatospora aurea TaxID=1337874 RepID=A0ABW2H3Y6_9ACTN